MSPQPVEQQPSIRFGEDLELDLRPRRLRRRGRILKLERIPLEILILLLEHRGEVVSRDEIVARVWGNGVYLDTDNSIRGAIRKVRQALKDDAESPRFIETITGQGYRFVAPIVDQTAVTPANVEIAEIKIDYGRQRARQWLVVGTVGLLAAVTVLSYVLFRRRSDAGTPKVRALAVLPLKNLSGDPSQEYLADSMTEALIGRLSGIHDLRIISRTSVMQFKDTKLSVPEIARTLHVDAVLEGSVMREGKHIRVHAQLIRGATDEHFWSEEYDRDLSDVLALQSSIAQAVAEKVQVTLTGQERSRLVASHHVAPEAYESFLKGAFTDDYSRAGVEKSIAYFEDAIKKDPSFAPAYVGLADAYFQYGTPGIGGAPPNEIQLKVNSAIRKAVELDPELPIAHDLLAAMYQEQWQWKDAELENRRALELNPNDSAAHLAFARWLLYQGRTEEALEWARSARELDPLGVTGNTMGWLLFQSRHYDEAIRELRSDLAVHPNDASSYWFLGYALIAKDQPDEAIPVLEKAVALSERSPAVIGMLVRAYAHAGQRAKALHLLDELKRRQKKGYVPAAAFLHAYLGLGDNEQAFVWLEKAYDEHSAILQFAKVHPFLDPLRSDPRFQSLLHRIGLDDAR